MRSTWGRVFGRLLPSSKGSRRALLIGSIAALVFAAFLLGRHCGLAPASQSSDGHAHEDHAEASQTWTCSMHPQIRMEEPGKCPLCHMDLVPVEEDGGDADDSPLVLKMSEKARALARVRTEVVERRAVERPVRMVGEVDYDETRVGTIAAWVDGRIDRMFVDFTGIAVRKGDHMVRLYSPDLRASQQELLAAARNARRYAEGDDSVGARSARSLLEAARERLRLWGMTSAQIRRVERRGKASDKVTVYAPLTGVVIAKHGTEGGYVRTGAPIYTIADLSQVWIHLEAYESDLPWLRYGQTVALHAEALPGEQFEGAVSFVDPFLDENKRTARVRVIVSNPEGRLRPGMYVHGVVSAGVDADGSPVAPDMSGKWMCPMHPEVVGSEGDRCTVCGMKLVPAEDLGFVSGSGTQAPLVVPASAPLITGKRAVVYVEQPDTEQPTYEGREIVLGPRAGDVYIVRDGLHEGERVVVEGNFKIDSAMQILARPAMMNPDGAPAPDAHGHHEHGGDASPAHTPSMEPPTVTARDDVPASFQDSLAALLDAYLALQGPLTDDAGDSAKAAVPALGAALRAVGPETLPAPARPVWQRRHAALLQQYELLAAAEDIATQRAAFGPLSALLISALREFGLPEGRAAFAHHCPMAFDNRGAWWIQADEQVRNPYYGEVMLRCADIVEPLRAKDGQPEAAP